MSCIMSGLNALKWPWTPTNEDDNSVLSMISAEGLPKHVGKIVEISAVIGLGDLVSKSFGLGGTIGVAIAHGFMVGSCIAAGLAMALLALAYLLVCFILPSH